MKTYRAYGLRIHSDMPLPELAPSVHADPDVRIRRRTLPSTTVLREHHECTADTATFVWPEVGRFRVRDGRDVDVEVLPGREERLVRLPLLGTVMAAVLHQRGFLVLHASAVLVDEQVAVLVGHKGWGKSTTAAALHARGHALVTDDILAVAPGDGSPRVVSGVPQFKLLPEAAEAALGDDPAGLPTLSRHSPKRARAAHDGFQSAGSWSIAAVYVLARGPELAIEAVPPRQAFVELIRYSYNLLPLKTPQEGLRPALFRRYAQLAERAPLKILRRRDDLEALPAIARLVEADLARGRAEEPLPTQENVPSACF
jgi:hypothetical protein